MWILHFKIMNYVKIDTINKIVLCSIISTILLWVTKFKYPSPLFIDYI